MGLMIDRKNPLYKEVLELEEQRIYGFEGLEPEAQLGAIEKEIKARIKITTSEIFTIGELLILAKPICKLNGITFENWIEEKYDFSLSTAKNFMNVNKNCGGVRDLAEQIPPSALYEISKPDTPKELKDDIISQANLPNLNVPELKRIKKIFRTGNEEAYETALMEISGKNNVTQQTKYTIDVCKKALSTLKQLNQSIQSRFDTNLMWVESSGVQPVASKINGKLFDAIQDGIDTLDKAIYESEELLKLNNEEIKALLK
jgi:hypothetical protein